MSDIIIMSCYHKIEIILQISERMYLHKQNKCRMTTIYIRNKCSRINRIFQKKIRKRSQLRFITYFELTQSTNMFNALSNTIQCFNFIKFPTTAEFFDKNKVAGVYSPIFSPCWVIFWHYINTKERLKPCQKHEKIKITLGKLPICNSCN